MKRTAIHVRCHSGYKYAERPTAITVMDVSHEVAEVIHKWRAGSAKAGEPTMEYFWVETTEGLQLKVGHTLGKDDWFLEE